VLAAIGWIGKSAATVLRERGKLREITRAGDVDTLKAREARPWALMEERIDDLEAALERVSDANDKLHAENDRLRDERDHARLQATDWQIEAHKAAGALARVTELQQQCEQERIAHQQIVERLSSEIRRLRGDH
jgi:chromosome segregation ATPase